MDDNSKDISKLSNKLGYIEEVNLDEVYLEAYAHGIHSSPFSGPADCSMEEGTILNPNPSATPHCFHWCTT